MKVLFKIFLLFVLPFSITAQTNIFKIDSLPVSGVQLNKNWKWHAGDNPEFAKAEFDDSAWESIDPSVDVFKLQQIPKDGQIIWLRLHLSVDSTVNKQLALMIEQSGASMLYLNGVLINQFGILSTISQEIKAFNPNEKPMPISFSANTVQVLSVRYALQPKISYATHFGSSNRVLSVKLISAQVAFEIYNVSLNLQNGWNSFAIGVNLVLFILYFAFYLYYSKRKANLYFSGYALFSVILNIVVLYRISINEVEAFFWTKNLDLTTGVIAALFLLTAVYHLFNRKKSIIFWSLIGLGFLSILMAATIYSWGWLIYSLPFNILNRLEILRISVLAMNRKIKGARIILIGAVISLIFFCIFQISISNNLYPNIFGYFFALAQIGIPFAVAIYLGYDFALTNRTLQQKLEENEKLSFEKQLILSTQNETLEKQVTERTAELLHKNRDLEIEAALERVRSKTMAMQHSNQLREIAGTTLEQLQSLGFTYGACSIIIMDAETGDMTWWISGFENDYPSSYGNIYFEHPFYLAQLNNWKEGKKYAVMVCEGEAKKEYDKFIFSKTEFVKIPIELQKIMQSFEKITFSNAYMKYGALSWSTEPLEDEYAKILQRFAGVFEQSYTRFLDLQKAEEQAREAQIEVALERVRSRAMAMQNSNELCLLIGSVYAELTKLDLDLDRCFFMLFDTKTQGVTWWMASGEAEANSRAYYLQYHEHAPQTAYYNGWKERKEKWQYIAEGESKKKWDEYIFAETELSQLPDFIIANMKSVKKVYLSASFFNYGCLTSGTLEPLTEASFDILVRFAKVFDSTYTRFMDLQKAEALAEQAHLDLIQIQTEKSRAEEALKILKATQAQLIQSEKLASLGELTAGIAHEIQNPLNFVNNFSKFSIGIAQELNTELNQPDIDKEYVAELLKDLTGNQEKINHHGNRASSIVSGMIEHSKPNTGVRELTDVNKLCDEYFRLVSNSWRAKNKDFNIEMIIHFDETLPKIEVVPQDIGRVLVNLINNAFYAVNERNNLVGFKNLRGLADDEKNLVGFENLRGYKPTVTVQTSQTVSHIEIHVKDNGIGMPEAVREKVFQPFFTTKPTGSGTGLGLSLAYDIITKGHGGTLKVESKEGVGSEFVIVLALKN